VYHTSLNAGARKEINMKTPSQIDIRSNSELTLRRGLLIVVCFVVSHMLAVIFSSLLLVPYLADRFLAQSAHVGYGRSMTEAKLMISAQVSLISALVGDLFAAVAVIFVATRILKQQLTRCGPTDAAWTLGSAAQLLQGTAYGVMLFIAVSFLQTLVAVGGHAGSKFGSWLGYHLILPSHLPQTFAATIMLLRFLVASPTEELVFRGILLGGASRTLGHPGGIVLSTALFIAVHFPFFGVQHIAGYVCLSIAAIALRYDTKAIGPSVACHVAYNISLLLVAVFTA